MATQSRIVERGASTSVAGFDVCPMSDQGIDDVSMVVVCSDVELIK